MRSRPSDGSTAAPWRSADSDPCREDSTMAQEPDNPWAFLRETTGEAGPFRPLGRGPMSWRKARLIIAAFVALHAAMILTFLQGVDAVTIPGLDGRRASPPSTPAASDVF